MLLNLHQIPEEGLDFDLERPNLLLDEGEGSMTLQQVRASFHLAWERSQLHISGRVSAVIRMRCSRCYQEFSFPTGENFDFLGLPMLDLRFPDNQRLSPQEMEITFLRGDEIDLDEIIRENIYLSIPIQPLCSESCPGLCSRCGKDLNEGNCTCPEEQGDPRFQSLESLRQEIAAKAK